MTSIQIRLLQGETLVVHTDAATFNAAFTAAVAEGGMVQVRNDEGHVLAINPEQIAYLEEVEPGQQEAGAPRLLQPVMR